MYLKCYLWLRNYIVNLKNFLTNTIFDVKSRMWIVLTILDSAALRVKTPHKERGHMKRAELPHYLHHYQSTRSVRPPALPRELIQPMWNKDKLSLCRALLKFLTHRIMSNGIFICRYMEDSLGLYMQACYLFSERSLWYIVEVYSKEIWASVTGFECLFFGFKKICKSRSLLLPIGYSSAFTPYSKMHTVITPGHM